MIDGGNHYKIVPYIRTPAVDTGESYPPTHLCMTIKDDYLGCFRDGSLKTICVDEWTQERTVERVWAILADGGHIITKEWGEKARKELRKIGKYRVRETEPFIVVQKLSGRGGEVEAPKEKPDGRKRVCLVRYGALGDHVFMSPLVEHFYSQGYHITYNCTERGADVFKGDKRIDHLMVQQSAAIRPVLGELDDYYRKWSRHFDEHWVLDGVIEDGLLRVEGKDGFADPWEKRAVECAGNYQDAHFERIGRPEIKGRHPSLWFSPKEVELAKGEVNAAKKKTGRSFIVLWSMAGSSFHKLYPWVYDVWSLCLVNGDDIGFITVGDAGFAAALEDQRFPNVYPRSGKQTIRQTLATLNHVDLIVTPETNTLAAGFGTNTPMIALLSHSARSNYTWRPFDIPLSPSPKDCRCYPCHQLHYTRLSCPRGVTEPAATLCMDQILPGDVYQAILRAKEAGSGHDTFAATEVGT